MPMKTVPAPPNEDERLNLLKRLEILESSHVRIFDAIIRSISVACDVPVALISLMDDYRLLFGFDPDKEPGRHTPETDFCSKMVVQDEVLVIPDILEDERFADIAAYSIASRVRFFAGIPMKLAPGNRLGTLCLVDHQPRTLNAKQMEFLELMASHIVAVFRLLLEKSESTKEYSSLVMVKQKLQFQKELTEAILDNEPEGVMILSCEGALEQINQAGMDMLEAASPEESGQQKLIDYVLPEFRAQFNNLIDKVLKGEHEVLEYRISGLRNTEKWLESHAAPLYDHHGEVSKLIAVTRDITDIRQSQQKLVLAARVFGEAQEGIIITDSNTVIVDVNPAFCQITGYSRDEIIGQTPKILQSGLQAPDFYVDMWRTLSTTGRWKGEVWSRKKNGELYAEILSINALRNEAGETINYVGLFLDITDYKREHGEYPEAHGSPVRARP